ncbi:MAG: type I pantothenate kinase [Hyphomicrobiaceae bacterium]|nr:type I pantothenate kinase [Hyphomicrobiaceae bacterium]
MTRHREIISPFYRFTIAEWARLRDGEPMTLSEEDLDRLRSLNDPISIEEAEKIYLPLTRLLSLYVEAIQNLNRASARFLKRDENARTPFILGVSGSVAVGKSTTARVLHALLRRWPSHPKVDLVTTDGFLYPNRILQERGLMEKKGFPESYDRPAFVKFLSEVKSGVRNIEVPTYSHLVYDVVEGENIIVDQPDILIVEGLNLLQPGEMPETGTPIMFASDFLDFGVYVDAEEADIRRWFLERFQRLRETAFKDPDSFFHQFASMSDEEAMAFGNTVWEQINLPNLVDNILPTRGRADLILVKQPDHSIGEVILRKL